MSTEQQSPTEAADSGNFPSSAGNSQVRPDCLWDQPEYAIFLPIEKKTKTDAAKRVTFEEEGAKNPKPADEKDEKAKFEVATAALIDQNANPDEVVEGGKDALSGQTALAEEDERLATHPLLHFFLDEVAENHYIIKRINSPKFVALSTLLLVTSSVAVAGQVHNSTTSYHFSVFVHLLTAIVVGCLGAGYYRVSVNCRRVIEANSEQLKYQELFKLAREGERYQLYMVVAFYPALALSSVAFRSCEEPPVETDVWDKLQCSLPIFGVTIFLQCIPLLIFRMRIILCLPLIALPALIYHITRSLIVGTEESSGYQTAKFLVEGAQTLVFMMVAWVVEKFHRKRFVAWIAYRRSERLAIVYRESLNSILELLLPPQCLKQLVMNQPAIDVAENSTISVCQVNDFCVWSTQVMPLVAVEVMDRVWSSFDLILHKNPDWRRRIRRLVATGDQFVCCLGLREAGTGQGDTPSASHNNSNAPETGTSGGGKESTRGIVQFAIEQRRTIRHFLRSDAVSAMVQPFQATIALATGHSVGAIMGTDRLVYGVQGPALKTANKLAKVAAHGTVLADPTTTKRAGPLRTRPFTATNSSITESLVNQMRHCSVIVGLAMDDSSTGAVSSPSKTADNTGLLGASSSAGTNTVDADPSPARSTRDFTASPFRSDRSITPYRDTLTPWSTGGTDQPGLSGRDENSALGLERDETASNSSSLQEFVQFQQQRGIGLNPDARQSAQMRLQELTFGTRRKNPDSWYDYRFVSERMEQDLWKFAITHANVVKFAFDQLLWTVTYAGVLVTCATDESLSWFGLFFLTLSCLWALFGRRIFLRRYIFGTVEKRLENSGSADATDCNNNGVNEGEERSPNGSLTGTTFKPPLHSPKGSMTRFTDKISSSNSNRDIFAANSRRIGSSNSNRDLFGTDKKKDDTPPRDGTTHEESSSSESANNNNNSSGSSAAVSHSSYNPSALESLQASVIPQTLMKTIGAFTMAKDDGLSQQEFNYNQQLLIRPAALLLQLTLFAIALAVGTATPMHSSPRGTSSFEQAAATVIQTTGVTPPRDPEFSHSILGTSFQYEFLLCSFLMYWHVTGEYVWYHGSIVMFIGATIVSTTFLSTAYFWGSDDAFYGLLMQMPLAWAALPVFFSALFQRERERRNSFCDSAFTEANFAIAEAELEINRALMKILLPKFVVEAVLKKQRGAIYNSVVHSLQEAIALEVRLPHFSNSSVLAGAEMVRKNSTGQLFAQDSFNNSSLGLSSGALLSSSNGTSVAGGSAKTKGDMARLANDVSARKSQSEFLGAGHMPAPLQKKKKESKDGGNTSSNEDIVQQEDGSGQKIDLLLEKALLSFNLVESALKWATEKDEVAGAGTGEEGVNTGEGEGLPFMDTANADLTILHVIGDSVVLAGPLIPPPKQDAPKPEKTERCVLREGADAQEKEKKQAAAGDIAVVKSAIAALKVLVWLENQVPGQITGVCVNAVGYASVVGRNHPTFALMGGAPRLANALTSAAPVGFLGATEAFLTLLHNHGVDLSLLRIALGLRQSWRIRGSGITGVRPLRIAIGDEEVLPHEDPTILAVSAAIEEATSCGAASGSQVSLGEGSILFSSGTGAGTKKGGGISGSIANMSFSPPSRPLANNSGGAAAGSATDSSSQIQTSTSEDPQEIQFNYCSKSATPTNGSFAPISAQQTRDPTVVGVHEPPQLFPPHPQRGPKPTSLEAPIPVSCLFPAHPAQIVDADGNAFQISAMPQYQQPQQPNPPHQLVQCSTQGLVLNHHLQQAHGSPPPGGVGNIQQSAQPHMSPPARQIPLEAFSSSSSRFPMGPRLQSIPKWRANPRAPPALALQPPSHGGGGLFPPHPQQNVRPPPGASTDLFPAHPPRNAQTVASREDFPPNNGPRVVTQTRESNDELFPSHPPRAYKSGSLEPVDPQKGELNKISPSS